MNFSNFVGLGEILQTFQKQVGVSLICVNVRGSICSVMERSGADPEATIVLTVARRVKEYCSLANSC